MHSSLNGAGAHSGIPCYESKSRIEEHIHALKLPATILRPVSFMENFATYNRPALIDGELVVNLAVRPELPMQRPAGPDVHVLRRASLRVVRPLRAAGGAPGTDAAGDLVVDDRLETLSA
ncbi:hypothetical protein GCM10022419_082450 [Nonomuraea rosea]|uniref:NmrA-like domain-containing protein n=1 Tax=Nonomuraea rosea TaxID=638574 RepID=A0ABP6YSM2_9ACTN